MDYVYEAKLEWVEDAWIASVPAFPGCFGSGRNVKSAVSSCAENLKLFIADYLESGKTLPSAEFDEQPQLALCVEVDSDFISASKCLTTKQAAEELGISSGRVSQLVKAGKLEGVMVSGKRMITIASVNKRKKAGVSTGRPRKQPTAAHPAVN